MKIFSKDKDKSVVKVCFEGTSGDNTEFLTVIGFEPNLSKVLRIMRQDGWNTGEGMAGKLHEPLYITMTRKNVEVASANK